MFKYSRAARQMDVIDRLIELFRDRDEYLVIRQHPNITGRMVEAAVDLGLLTRAYNQAARAPENVRFVMPDEDYSSYSILWQSDAVIAFASTIRLEAVARGIPCATIDQPTVAYAATHRITDESPEGLSRLVDRLFAPESRPGLAAMTRTYRCTYTLLRRLSLNFKSFEYHNDGLPHINLKSFRELLPGNDPALDQVCDHILRGTSLYAKPDRIDREGEPFERQFLEKLSEKLSAQRNRYREAAGKRARRSVPAVTLIRVAQGAASGPIEDASLLRRFPTLASVTSSPRALPETIVGLDSEYVLITFPDYQYDESWLPCALSILEGRPEAPGVRGGMWLKHSQALVGEAFTKRDAFLSWEEASLVLPLSDHPLHMLGMCLLRRSAAATLLREVAGADARQTAELLIRLFQSPVLHHFPWPMMVFSTPAEPRVAELILRNAIHPASERIPLTALLKSAEIAGSNYAGGPILE